jgi:hypothetical protein
MNNDDHFGVCPHCGKNDGFLNIGRAHWFVCHEHQMKWRAGENLFSNWRDETEEDWRRNHYRIGHYHELDYRKAARARLRIVK